MRRMYDEDGIKKISASATATRPGIDPDELTESGIYKVSQLVVNGIKYDGTLVVLPWDSNYYRQVFYTIATADPNPIFTRVRVNKKSPWKAWLEIGGATMAPSKNKITNVITNKEVGEHTYIAPADGWFHIYIGGVKALDTITCGEMYLYFNAGDNYQTRVLPVAKGDKITLNLSKKVDELFTMFIYGKGAF